MLLLIRRLKISFMTAFLPLSLQVCDGESCNCCNSFFFFNEMHVTILLLILIHIITHRWTGHQCERSTYKVGRWTSKGCGCTHHYPDSNQNSTCSVCPVTQIFFDYMLRLPIKAEKCHCHLSCKSLSPGYAMTEMRFIFTTPLTTPEFTTKSSSRVLK